MTDNFYLYQKIQLQTFRGFDKHISDRNTDSICRC
jgi:hypothetical protein